MAHANVAGHDVWVSGTLDDAYSTLYVYYMLRSLLCIYYM